MLEAAGAQIADLAEGGIRVTETKAGLIEKTTRSRRGGAKAFTLIELMVAVGIMAVLMTVAIPRLYQDMHQDSMRKAVSDVMEVCSHARARAILDGTAMELRIRPAERYFSVVPATRSDEEVGVAQTFSFQGHELVERTRTPVGGAALSVKLSESILVEGLGVNGEDWTEDEEARVRFYPNGTCDEMSIVLLSDKGERRNIWLEVVTGMAELEVDPQKFRAR